LIRGDNFFSFFLIIPYSLFITFSLFFFAFPRYTHPMILQQTVTIPADRRLVIDVPETWTGNSVRFVIFPVGEEASAQESAPAAALPPKPEGLPADMKFDFWQDRVRPLDDPLAWLDAHGPFDGPSVDEFLAKKHAENEREEAKMDALFHRTLRKKE
jgi:hypothetical protein